MFCFKRSAVLVVFPLLAAHGWFAFTPCRITRRSRSTSVFLSPSVSQFLFCFCVCFLLPDTHPSFFSFFFMHKQNGAEPKQGLRSVGTAEYLMSQLYHHYCSVSLSASLIMTGLSKNWTLSTDTLKKKYFAYICSLFWRVVSLKRYRTIHDRGDVSEDQSLKNIRCCSQLKVTWSQLSH